MDETPRTPPHGPRRLLRVAALAGAFVALLVPAAQADESIEKRPGYVDFGDLLGFANGEESVEVYLTQPLLSIVEALISSEEPELADMVEDLALVKVNVFSFDGERIEDLEATADRIAGDLSGRGWQQLVKVKQREERVLLYVLPTTEGSGDEERQLISGVVVVVLEGDDLDRASRSERRHFDDNEAVFVNIVGRFDLLAIAKLVGRFDVPHLDDLEEWDEWKKSQKRSGPSR